MARLRRTMFRPRWSADRDGLESRTEDMRLAQGRERERRPLQPGQCRCLGRRQSGTSALWEQHVNPEDLPRFLSGGPAGCIGHQSRNQGQKRVRVRLAGPGR